MSRVLVPRLLTQTQAQLAQQLGLRVIEFDVLQIKHTPREELMAQWPNLSEPHAVVFTSANAVNAIVAARMLRQAIESPLVQVGIGAKTQQRLDVFGIMAQMPPQANAAQLGEWLIAEYPQVQAVVHPCASNARPELGAVLAAQTGIKYYPVVAYTTQYSVSLPRLEAVAANGLHALLLTSPDVAAAVLEPWPLAYPLPQLLAIGDTTAAYLSTRGLQCEIASEPSIECLLELAAQKVTG